MKLSRKYLLPLSAALAAVAFASPAFAWNQAICNPATGEVLQGGGAAPLTTENLYSGYLRDHPGSFEMGAGQDCKKTTTTPAATTQAAPGPAAQSAPIATAPSTLTVAAASVVPSVQHDIRPWFCHFESTVGFATPRRSNDLGKDLDKPGNTSIGANGQCAKPELPGVVAAPLIPVKAQIVAAPAMPVAPVLSLVTPAPAARMPEPAVPVLAVSEVEGVTAIAVPPMVATVVDDQPDFAPPAAGDGTGADVLVP